MCEACLAYAQLAELQAIYADCATAIEHACEIENGTMQQSGYDAMIEFMGAFQKITGNRIHSDMLKGVWVQIQRGKHAGKSGFMHGTFETRKTLMAMGLRKTTIRLEPSGEIEMFDLDNLRELT